MQKEELPNPHESNGDAEFAALLTRLVTTLQHSRAMYAFDTIDHRRFAAKASLAACNLFIIRAIPNGIDLVKPLRELLDCLSDLDKGIKCPVLTPPRKRRGARPTSRGVETFRATAAVLMEIYQWEGKLRLDAAEAAANDLNQRGYCDERGKAITAGRIEDWRDRVNEGGDSLGATRFEALCAELKVYSCQEARQLVFQSLSLIPGSRIPIDPAIERIPDKPAFDRN